MFSHNFAAIWYIAARWIFGQKLIDAAIHPLCGRPRHLPHPFWCSPAGKFQEISKVPRTKRFKKKIGSIEVTLNISRNCSLSLSLFLFIWENHRILAVYPVFFVSQLQGLPTFRLSNCEGLPDSSCKSHKFTSCQISPVSTIFHEVLWHFGRFHPVSVSISSFGHLFAVTNVGSSPAAQDEFILDINTLVECQMMSFKQNPTLLNLLQPPIVWGDIQWGC